MSEDLDPAKLLPFSAWIGEREEDPPNLVRLPKWEPGEEAGTYFDR